MHALDVDGMMQNLSKCASHVRNTPATVDVKPCHVHLDSFKQNNGLHSIFNARNSNIVGDHNSPTWAHLRLGLLRL
jgi:hypothetical protein